MTPASQSGSSIASDAAAVSGSELVDRSEERLRALGVGRAHAVTLGPDVAADPLLTGRGYREVRRFWEMTIELGDDPPPEPRLPAGFRIEPFSSELARRLPRRARGGVRRTLGVPARGVRGVVGTTGRETGSRSVAVVRRTRPARTSRRRPVTIPSDPDGGWIGALGVRGPTGEAAVSRRRCCFTASASSTGAGSAGSASVSTPRTQPVRRSFTRASAWWSTRSRSSGRRCSRERPPVRRRRRAGRRGAHLRRRGALLRPPRPAHRRGHPHVPAVLQGDVDLGGGRPGGRERVIRRARRRGEHPRRRRRQGTRPRDGDRRARRGVRARGGCDRRSMPAPPSRTLRRERSSSRAAIARCGASTRWRSS